MSLRAKVLHGISWNFTSRLGTQLFQLGFNIVLARILSPHDYGLIGMLVVFTGFAVILSDSGLSAALIYRQDITDAHTSSVFWLQSGIGLALTLIFYFGAPFVAIFYDMPQLEQLTQFVSVIFIVQALGQTQSSLLTKTFQFPKLAIANIASTVLSGGLAIILALRGFGVWSLAWQIVVSAAITTCAYWFMSDWRPRFLFDRKATKELAGYAFYLLGHSGLNYWLRNGDNLLIGKFLGATQLGIYARAYSLMLLPMNNISSMLGQVMFPALSQIQNDIPKFREVYMKAVRMIALVSFPMMTGLAALTQPVTVLLLGEKWLAIVPVLQVLSFVGLLQSVIFPVGWVFTSLGHTKTQFHLSIVLGVVFLLLIALSLRYGVVGVAYAYMAWTFFGAYMNLRLVAGYLNTSVSSFVFDISGIFGVSLTMGALVFVLDRIVFASWGCGVRVAIGTTIGAILYLSLSVVTKTVTLTELRHVALRR